MIKWYEYCYVMENGDEGHLGKVPQRFSVVANALGVELLRKKEV